MDEAPGMGDAAFDVLVIGAGQAGLAAAWHLSRAGARYLLVDAATRIGDSWRSRYDSMRLFTPVEYDSLPGLPFPGLAGSYPGKDDVADYLEEYARHLEVPLLLGTAVLRVRADGERFVAETTGGTLTADRVIVATGACCTPYVPAEPAAGLGAAVVQLHSADYRHPGELPDGPVLVVGAGNSGVQIAEELAAAGRPVDLAVGTRSRALPQRFLGRDLCWWLIRLGLTQVPTGAGARPEPGRRGRLVRAAWRQLRTLDNSLQSPRRSGGGFGTLIGTSWRRVRRSGVVLRPRVVSASPGAVRFADDTSLDVGTVVWATGYRPDYSWLDIPGVIVDGTVEHTGGLTAVPGLAFLGLIGQRSLTSEWLGFVADDAGWVTEHLLDVGSSAVPGPDRRLFQPDPQRSP
jgi:putative flavoprotein involved in K+ transport